MIPPALLQDYQKLLSSAPARRLNPAKVAQSRFLNNRLVDVVAFMENIAVKDSVEKVGTCDVDAVGLSTLTCQGYTVGLGHFTPWVHPAL